MSELTVVDEIYVIPVTDIHADFNWNIREPSDLELEELKKSIKEMGQKDPGEVSLASAEQFEKYGKKYLLNSGFRRFQAILDLGINGYKATVSEPLSEDERIKVNFLENHGRKQLNLYETTKPFIQHIEHGWTEERIMKEYGLSRSYVQVRAMLARMILAGHTKLADISRKTNLTYEIVRKLNSIEDYKDCEEKIVELDKQVSLGLKPKVNKTDVKTKRDINTMLMERTKSMRQALIQWAYSKGIPYKAWGPLFAWSNGVIDNNTLMQHFDDLIHDPRHDEELSDVFENLESYKGNLEGLYIKLHTLKENALNRTYERPINGFPEK